MIAFLSLALQPWAVLCALVGTCTEVERGYCCPSVIEPRLGSFHQGASANKPMRQTTSLRLQDFVDNVKAVHVLRHA